MLKTIEGVFREGKIELRETPEDVRDSTPVVVTFLESRPIDLRTLGVDENQAADLRARLATFAEDWERPEMDGYDDYDAADASAVSR
jgi:hypothetical protein